MWLYGSTSSRVRLGKRERTRGGRERRYGAVERRDRWMEQSKGEAGSTRLTVGGRLAQRARAHGHDRSEIEQKSRRCI